MIVRERLVAHVRRYERPARLINRQAPSIACHRDETDIARIGMWLRQVEQTVYAHTTPALRAIEATSAVEQRHQLVEMVYLITCASESCARDKREQFLISQRERFRNSAINRQPPGSEIDGPWRIRYPARAWKRIPQETVSLPRASETSRSAGKREKALRHLLRRPERYRAAAKAAKRSAWRRPRTSRTRNGLARANR